MLNSVFVRVYGYNPVGARANAIIVTEVIKELLSGYASVEWGSQHPAEHCVHIAVEFKKGWFLKRLMMYIKLKQKLNQVYYKPYTKILFWI